MSDDRKEFKFVITDKLAAQMENDPKLAQAIREMMATFRQARHAVETGQHKTFEDAVEAITGNRPERLENDEDDDAS